MSAAPRGARGDSLMLYLEPTYSFSETSTRNAAGARDTGETRQYAGVYQLSFQKDLYESIGLRSSFTLLDSRGTSTFNGITADQEAFTWTGDATLGFGQGLLTGSVMYLRNDSSTSTRSSTDPFARAQPSIVREAVGASLSWTPIDLPTLDGRITRDHTETLGVDQSGLTAGLNSTYDPGEHIRLAGTVGYSEGTDHVNDVESASVTESANAVYSQSFFGRTNVHAQGQLSHSSSSVRTSPTSGPVRTARPGVEGLSLVEGFADLPERDTLQTNALVIDGDLAGGVGLNIGWGPTLAGDQALRDVGLRFIDIDPVSLIEVWVDEQLPAPVSSAYVWSVYRSDDNLNWTAVSITGAVVFHPAWNRFEIPIAATAARYLKVVTRPLSTAVSPDPRFRDVAITEVRTFLLESPEDVRGRSSSVGATLTGAVGTMILQEPNLRYDFAGALSSSDWEAPAWFVTNGLSLSHRFGSTLTAAANVLRTDSGGEVDWDWRTQYGASLTALPLPTLTSGAAFSGYFTRAGGRGNGASIYGRAALYRGVDVSANGGYSVSTAPNGRKLEGTTVSGTASVTPVGRLTLTGSAVTSWTRATGGEQSAASSRNSRLDGNVALSPVPALYLSAGVSRLFGTAGPPKTIMSLGVSYSPMRDGDLILSFAYGENYDTLTKVRNRSSSGSVRWNFIPSGFVEATYALTKMAGPQTATEGQFAGGRLGVTL